VKKYADRMQGDGTSDYSDSETLSTYSRRRYLDYKYTQG
jgi:hypothetical protein